MIANSSSATVIFLSFLFLVNKIKQKQKAGFWLNSCPLLLIFERKSSYAFALFCPLFFIQTVYYNFNAYPNNASTISNL